jgi:hypothetical protein
MLLAIKIIGLVGSVVTISAIILKHKNKKKSNFDDLILSAIFDKCNFKHKTEDDSDDPFKHLRDFET